MKAKKRIIELSDKRVVCIESNATPVNNKIPAMLMVLKGNSYDEKKNGGILLSEEKLAGAKVIGFID